MKTKTVGSRLALLAITIAAALVTQPMRATAIDTLVITEFSSTSLTATLNNNPLSVSNNGADNWIISLAGINSSLQLWTEPGAAGVFNLVEGQSRPNTIIVTSEFITTGSGLADGTPDTTTFTLNGSPLSVTFFDKGDVAAAPDTGMTASLFGLSLAGLAFFRRKLC
jgi:hypothetical protein